MILIWLIFNSANWGKADFQTPGWQLNTINLQKVTCKNNYQEWLQHFCCSVKCSVDLRLFSDVWRAVVWSLHWLKTCESVKEWKRWTKHVGLMPFSQRKQTSHSITCKSCDVMICRCKKKLWSKSVKPEASVVCWDVSPFPPQLSREGINLTGRSLRPRTLSNKRLRQSDRLIYREHDTDVTAPFVFSFCQCIKMQGVCAPCPSK